MSGTQALLSIWVVISVNDHNPVRGSSDAIRAVDHIARVRVLALVRVMQEHDCNSQFLGEVMNGTDVLCI